MRKILDDLSVLERLKELRQQGRTDVLAGEIARYFSVDSVRALGAMLRVQRQLKKRDACNLSARHHAAAGEQSAEGKEGKK